MNHSETQLPPEVLLGKMILGKFTTHLIYVAAELGLADRLKEGPRTAEKLAEETGTHAQSLYRVLRALAGLGVFEETEAGFGLTPMAEALQTEAPNSQRSLARLMGSRFHSLAWMDLIDAVRTGKPAFEHHFKMGFDEYLAKHPEDLDLLQGVMSESTDQEAAELPEAYDFSPYRTLVDVGGGRGALLIRLLKDNPASRGILLDAPHVVAGLQDSLDDPDLSERLKMVSGDFREGVPRGGDLYILKRVLHDWDDHTAGLVLDHCRQAMNPDGRVIIIEQIVEPGNAPSFAKMADMEMLVVSPGGRERTAAEFRALLTRAGLKLERIIPSRSWSIIEARPEA